jgi:hypothetical protein
MGRGSKYHGKGSIYMYVPWVGGRYTIGRESKYHGWGVDIPCVGGSRYNG